MSRLAVADSFKGEGEGDVERCDRVSGYGQEKKVRRGATHAHTHTHARAHTHSLTHTHTHTHAHTAHTRTNAHRRRGEFAIADNDRQLSLEEQVHARMHTHTHTPLLYLSPLPPTLLRPLSLTRTLLCVVR